MLAIPLFLFSFAVPATAEHKIAITCSSKEAGKYQKVEFTLDAPSSYTNCFDPDEVDLTVQVTTPSGRAVLVPAFWYQPYERGREGGRDWMYPSGLPRWQARFAPQELGKYEAIGLLKDARGTTKSQAVQFRCVPSGSKGFIRVSAKDPRFFEFTEGQPFFPIGQNLAFIGNQQYVTLSKAEQIFGKLSENGANYLRIWTCCEDWAMAIEARKSAFGRSWDWRPPLVPLPGAEESARKCLQLSQEKNTVRIDPSHPLAVKPSTAYIFAGKFRVEPGVTLRAELSGKQSELTPRADGAAVQDSERRATASAPYMVEFKQQFQTDAGQSWLAPVTLRSEGQGTAWVGDLSLREAGGGPELLWEADVNRPIRGYFNPLDSFMLDELVAAAEKQSIYLQLCYLTRDVYMRALKDTATPEYERAIKDAQKAVRYAVARWGYSTSIAAWEYWNEMDPGLPTDRFYTALGAYLDQVDPFKHLRTTSTWGPSVKDCRHASLDIADVHFYLRPADKGRLEDEVDAVLERTRWIRQQAPNKPAHLGEFGIANDKWQPTEEMKNSPDIVDFHNAIWASALSGASGTAMFWWWDRLDPRDSYSHYKPLSRFLAEVPWTSGDVQPAAPTCSEPRVRPVALQAKDRVWIRLFDRDSAWHKAVVEARSPTPIAKALLHLAGLPPGSYQIQWYDTRQGNIIRQQTGSIENGTLNIEAPDFTRDLACTVRRQR